MVTGCNHKWRLIIKYKWNISKENNGKREVMRSINYEYLLLQKKKKQKF